MRTRFYTPFNPAGFTGQWRQLGNDKEAIQQWLSQQESYTKHKPIRRRFRRRRVIVLGKGDTWGLDLIDMSRLKQQNDQFAYVLIVIDLFSKKLDLRPLKRKFPSDVIAAFDDIIKGPVLDSEPLPAFVQSDSGGEFSPLFSRHVQKTYRIKHYRLLNPDIKSAITERAIRTLRTRLYRFFTHKKSNRYLDVLPKLVQSYNNRFHTSIKMAPNQVTFANQDEVRFNLYGTSDIADLLQHDVNQLPANRRLRQTQQEFSIGDRVRISKHKNIFKQGYLPNFTDEVFIILDRHPKSIKRGVRTLYTLMDLNSEKISGRFYSEELVHA